MPSPSHRFTPERRARFIEALAETGNVRAACAHVAVSRVTAYDWRRRDAGFARGWDAALTAARERAEEALADSAINGWQETVFYRGKAVGQRHRFSAALLLTHLGRLDKQLAQMGQPLDPGEAQEELAEFFARGV